jgi:hypothetical protein
MGAQVLCGFRVAFQKFTLRQSELLDEVVNVLFPQPSSPPTFAVTEHAAIIGTAMSRLTDASQRPN